MIPVILAAGEGSRIGKKTTNLPKWFLEINDYRICDYQLDTLSHFFDRVVLVFGHGFSGHKEIEDVIPAHDDIEVIPLLYSDWAETENAGTACFALNHLDRDEDLLLVCGDVIFDVSFLSSIMSAYTQIDERSAVAAFEGIQDEKTAVALDSEQEIIEYGKIRGHEEAGLFILNEKHLDRAANLWSQKPHEWFPIIFPEIDSTAILVEDGVHYEINRLDDLKRAKRDLEGEQANS
ncbi:NTP transferase domain-containing protein [Halobacterium salinarum]|uniref:NTP transferase domain-containing protein n=1 Tax=Halobacterium salinarum TaxID=2242 RepID=UPI0030D1A8CC